MWHTKFCTEWLKRFHHLAQIFRVDDGTVGLVVEIMCRRPIDDEKQATYEKERNEVAKINRLFSAIHKLFHDGKGGAGTSQTVMRCISCAVHLRTNNFPRLNLVYEGSVI